MSRLFKYLIVGVLLNNTLALRVLCVSGHCGLMQGLFEYFVCPVTVE